MPVGISPGGRPINTAPLGKPPRDNWIEKVHGQLPAYVRGVARGVAKSAGHPNVTSRDIQIAIGVMNNWASGKGVSKPVQAAAAKALAQWEALKAKAKALRAK